MNTSKVCEMADVSEAQRLRHIGAVLLCSASERPDDRGLAEVMPLFSALLGVPTGERYPALTLTPEVQKRRTLATPA